MERAPDKWDLKAAQIHGDPPPTGAPVRIVGISTGVIVRVVLIGAAVWFGLGAVGVVILLAIGVI